MAEIYDGRAVITDPAGLPKGLTADEPGTGSALRNKTAAGMLHRAGWIKKMGTGIKKIRSSMEKAGLKAPTFESDHFLRRHSNGRNRTLCPLRRRMP